MKQRKKKREELEVLCSLFIEKEILFERKKEENKLKEINRFIKSFQIEIGTHTALTASTRSIQQPSKRTRYNFLKQLKEKKGTKKIVMEKKLMLYALQRVK